MSCSASPSGIRRPLGDSLHGLIALLLLIGLFLGLRMHRELRGLLGDLADSMQAIPGLGSKLLVVVAAWYLMRLIRRRSGAWIEAGVPRRLHSRITPLSEGPRAILLAGFVLWLAEGWFDGPPWTLPKAVQAVRVGDTWLKSQLQGPPERPMGQPRGYTRYGVAYPPPQPVAPHPK